MSDERDETRPFTSRPGNDDATRAGGFPADDETRLNRPSDDETRAAGPSGDETRVGRHSRDETWVELPSDDETVADPLPPRTDPTSVMSPVDDWASSRANPAWSGRAEVRAPQPSSYPRTNDWPDTMGSEPRGHWWMPIVVGIIAVILLAALAFGIYLIVQNSDSDETPAPPPAPSVAPTQTATTSTPSTPPSTEPTTTEPSPTASTTNPTTVAVTIPALKGMPLPQAEAALSSMGLRWRVIVRDDDALPGTVIDSDPAEGQEVPPDTRITLVVAQGVTPPTGPSLGPG